MDQKTIEGTLFEDVLEVDVLNPEGTKPYLKVVRLRCRTPQSFASSSASSSSASSSSASGTVIPAVTLMIDVNSQLFPATRGDRIRVLLTTDEKRASEFEYVMHGQAFKKDDGNGKTLLVSFGGLMMDLTVTDPQRLQRCRSDLKLYCMLSRLPRASVAVPSLTPVSMN